MGEVIYVYWLVVMALWLLAGIGLFLFFRLRRLRIHLKMLLEQNQELQILVENGDRKFALLFEASPDAIVTSDLEGKITSVNSATLRIFQYPDASRILGRHILDFVHADDREKAMTNLSDMYHGKYNGPEDYRSLRADGSMVDLSVNAEFTTDSQGVRNGFLFIERDVSARRAYEAALAESNRHWESLSNTDGLTELPNRRFFDDFWRRECSVRRFPPTPFPAGFAMGSQLRKWQP